MKSKRIVALALTAAIAVSAVSTTAFAATASVKEKANINEQTATVTLNADEDANMDADDTVENLPTLPNTSLYKFMGWSTKDTDANIAEYDKAFKDSDVKATLVKSYYDIFGIGGKSGGTDTDEDKKCDIGKDLIDYMKDNHDEDGKCTGVTTGASGGAYYTRTLYPVYRRWASEEEAQKAAEDAKNAEDKAAAEKTRAEHLDAEDANHSAVGNTKDENGARKTAPAAVTPDDKGGKDSETDPYTTKEREHLLNIAKASDGNQVVYLFDVTAPTGLLEGMNARVTLPIPGGTDGYKVTVYHIVDAYKRQKVSGLDVGANDVTFWANDFSPYVAVLTPKDAVASTGTDNPGTGDFSAVPVALLAAAALGATGFVAYKKRKAE